MTLEDVKKAVAHIESIKGDSEMAHVKEDELWEEVLKEIVFGNAEYKKMAIEALKTKDIDFSRWYS